MWWLSKIVRFTVCSIKLKLTVVVVVVVEPFLYTFKPLISQ